MDDDGQAVLSNELFELRAITDNLVRAAVLQLEAQRLALARANGTAHAQLPLEGFVTPSLADAPTDKRPYRPRNPLHRVWRTFVLDMQKHQERLGRNRRPTKQNFTMVGAESVKTITRTMENYFQMQADDWPPSTWDPDQPPAGYTGE